MTQRGRVERASRARSRYARVTFARVTAGEGALARPGARRTGPQTLACTRRISLYKTLLQEIICICHRSVDTTMNPGAPESDEGRTVIDVQTISANGQWWSGIVHDRERTSGEERVRLEMRLCDAVKGWSGKHTWRVRPDYWAEERELVDSFGHREIGGNVPANPLDTNCKVNGFRTVRKSDRRWVALVEMSYSCGYRRRLYHWELPAGERSQPQNWRRRQVWNTNKQWDRTKRVANRWLSKVGGEQ